MNQFPPPYNLPPQEPKRPFNQPPQEFPSQPGVPPYPQYPNYQPQSGQFRHIQLPQNRPMAQLPYQQFQTTNSGAGKKKKKRGPWFWILIVIGIIILFSICSVVSQAANHTVPTSNTSVNTTDTRVPTDTPAPTATKVPTATPAPTDTPVPTVSPAQLESVYKATTLSITVDNLDKEGDNDKGKDMHFTCKILKFVKDSSGNTAGANVEAPDSYSTSIIQIIFPSGTDLSKLNEGDILEVWGTDEGVFSGQNAFGGTVQEVGIGALYMTDQTTNYQTI